MHETPSWLRDLRRNDEAAARLARCEAQIKLRIGEAFDAFFELGGHLELGCSSFEAYVVEHCQQSRAWGRKTRALAKHVREKKLTEIRRALLQGRLSTSMAELLARYATTDTELALLERASKSTVREMRAHLRAKPGVEAREEEAPEEEADDIKMHPTRWVTDGEVAMLEASRVLVEYLNGATASDEALMTAMLGEAETTLQSLQEGTGQELNLHPVDPARLEEALRRLREARKARLPAVRDTPQAAAAIVVGALDDPPLPKSIEELHREIMRCTSRLAARNLELGRLLRAIFRIRGWRRLGYETPGHYASERLGLSLSSVEHRITLASRALDHPELAEAIAEGRLGYESALLVSRVLERRSRSEVVEAWIGRAEKRTVKHLREEVRAVLLAVELDHMTSRLPPTEEDLEAVFELERKIQSGELLRALPSSRPPQTSIALTIPTGSRRRLQLTVSVELYAHFLNVESQFRALAGERAPFISFLCTSLYDAWLPFLEAYDQKWKHIHLRDRHRCSSPICERRDVTLHHIHPRGRGGTDDPENLNSPCAWCHLEGAHQDRIRIEGPATSATWIFGRDPVMVVSGREKIAIGNARTRSAG